MPCLLRALVVIIVLPLNAISIEQKVKIKELPRIRPVHVYKEIISKRLLGEIRIRVYTHILILLELLARKKLYKILTYPTFHAYISLVVINKVHLIANQGGLFRSSYIQLQKVRSLLGQRPQFTYTTTLNDITFKII